MKKYIIRKEAENQLKQMPDEDQNYTECWTQLSNSACDANSLHKQKLSVAADISPHCQYNKQSEFSSTKI